MPLSRKQRLLVVAENLEGFWAQWASDDGSDDHLVGLAKQDAAVLREVAATLPEADQ